MANQSSLGLKREQVAAADLTRQAQQIQWSPGKPRTRRGGSPPPSIRSIAIATGCIPASPAWNRGWSPSPGPSPGRVPLRLRRRLHMRNRGRSKPAAVAGRCAGSNRPGHGARCRQIHASAAAEPGPAAVYSAAKDAAKTDAAKADSAKLEARKGGAGKGAPRSRRQKRTPSSRSPQNPRPPRR